MPAKTEETYYTLRQAMVDSTDCPGVVDVLEAGFNERAKESFFTEASAQLLATMSLRSRLYFFRLFPGLILPYVFRRRK